MSAAMAERLSMVSSSVSPLAVELRPMSSVNTSADRRLAAMSNVVRVRVLFSKNRLNTLLPRSRGTFLTSRSLTLTKLLAVSRTWVRMSLDRPSVDSRWISSPFLFSWGLRLYSTLCLFDFKLEGAVFCARQCQRLAGGQRHTRGGKFGGHGQLTATAVHQHGQAHACWAAIVVQLVEDGAHRASGVEHIVQHQNVGAVHIKVQLGLHALRHAALCEVVAVQGRGQH